jgi:hypothetical protein
VFTAWLKETGNYININGVVQSDPYSPAALGAAVYSDNVPVGLFADLRSGDQTGQNSSKTSDQPSGRSSKSRHH